MNKILIVDDSKTSRMFIKMCLEIAIPKIKAGTFYEAENGKEALALLNHKETELVIMDLNMPLMDGSTLLRWMKDDDQLKNIPVIVITSTNNTAKREELLQMGADHILGKPVSPAKLAPIVKSITGDPSDTDDYGA